MWVWKWCGVVWCVYVFVCVCVTRVRVCVFASLALLAMCHLFFLHIFLRSFSTSLFFNTEINTQFASV